MGKITLLRSILVFSVVLLSSFSSVFGQPPVDKDYEAIMIDFCTDDDSVLYNFYWKGGHVSNDPFFGSNDLDFTTFTDGTALISGTTMQGNCMVEVHVVLVNLMNWTDWQASGGTFKSGMGCGSPDPATLMYYEIDNSQSYVVASGAECNDTGTLLISQRPDPADPNTPHLGGHIGPGGALYDTDTSANGFATWGWMGPQGDERKYEIDFNFILRDKTVEPEPPTCEITATPVSCYGAMDGTATAQVYGGTPPFTYSWSGGISDTDNHVENLGPGSYTLTVTDSKNLQTQCEVTIEGPRHALECQVEKVSDVTVYGGKDGSATVNPSGGTAPYTYKWDNGETAQTATMLDAGTHTVTVTDKNGCKTECKVEIREPGALRCSVEGTDVDCYGDASGSATATVQGGMQPYTYSWDNGVNSTTETAENLEAGTYTLTVTDKNGAKTECQVTIEQPARPLQCEVTKNQNVSINGGSDGSATVNASGGTAPYTYKWDNGETTQTATQLDEGVHKVTVTDKNGCKTECEVEIGEPGALTCSIEGTDVLCYGGSTGSAKATVGGGVQPYTFSWDNGVNSTDNTADNLMAGTYTLTVTDHNGAKTECQVTIEQPDRPLVCDVTKVQDVSVYGGSDGSATANPSGGTPPYSYKWDNDEETQTAVKLTAGTHEVTVTDANGCVTKCEILIEEPRPLQCSIEGTDVSCYDGADGSATATVSGGVGPYKYSWNGGINSTTDTAENLGAGTYELTVTDDNGAMTTCEVTINEPLAALTCTILKNSDVSENGGSDGSATVNPSGGTAPFSYLWDNGETNQQATGLSAGTHKVTVTDANGCETECEIEIEEPDVETPEGCETAFARYEGSNTCFLDDGFNRWGWTNFVDTEGAINMELYAAAGQCNLNKGEQSGNVTVNWNKGTQTISVTITMIAGFTLTEAQLYIGSDKYPEKNGSPTVAPGQYSVVVDGLNNVTQYTFNDFPWTDDNGFYIIVHGVSCGHEEEDEEEGRGNRQPLSAIPFPTVFQDQLQIYVTVPQSSEASVTLFGLNGQEAARFEELPLHKGANILEIPTDRLQPSLYFMMIKTREGYYAIRKVMRSSE